jgi:putative ABC transport system permease protein
MLGPKYIPLVIKQVVRHRTRTLLTVTGVVLAMFLFCAVQAMQAGVRAATETTAKDTTLVVYRENRFCPATSRLPQFYEERIAKVPGVASVVPVKIVVTNCRTSLDVITFRGVPEEAFVSTWVPRMELIAGNVEGWQKRTDAALVGETLASRRGWKVGDMFDAVGVKVYVAGILRSDEAQDQNVAYVHLPFLQQSMDRRLGIVTQFNVKVSEPSKMKEIAAAIDDEFRSEQSPTYTSPEKAFVARAASDVVEIIGFTRYLGIGSLIAVLALVANAIVLSVQDRVREHAVLQTLGYKTGLIARMIVAEGLLLGLIGGIGGTVLAVLVMKWGHFSLSTEGLSIQFVTTPGVVIGGMIVSVVLGMLAGLVPAWQASRREITQCFRAV